MYNIRGQHWWLQGCGCERLVSYGKQTHWVLIRDAEEVVVDAYTMCNGQAYALPNTHSTITATLIVQSSMPSVVLVAPTLTTMSTSASKSSSTSSSSFAAITSPRTTAPSTLSIQTATGSPTRTSATVTSGTAQAASERASATPTLTKSQVVGISVASVGGAALAIGTLILFACWRRRKRARDSDLLPFQMDPSYGYGFKGPTEVMKRRKGPGGTANGIAAKVAPPVPPRIDAGSPNMFARRSIRPDIIGLAISPERNEAIDRRHSSKLLPEKPTLTLQVPQGKAGGGLKFSQPIQPSAISRQSTATQFEEDDFDSADTTLTGREDWGRGSTEQILNNQTGNWGTIRPVPPDSGESPRVVVSPSDWRPQNLSSSTAALVLAPSFKVKPLKIGRNIGSFSRPLGVGNDPLPKPPPPAQLEIPAGANRPITQSSSIYSTHNSSLPPSEAGRNSNAIGRKSYISSGPYDRQASTGSLTSFETVDSMSCPQDPEPKTAVTDLSPVVESPASGKSPVSYPKIPGRLSRDYIRMVPPPPQPDFGAVFSSQSGIKPWKIAEMNAQRERDRIQAQTQRQAQAQAHGLGNEKQGQSHVRPQRNYIAPSAAYNSVPSQNRNESLAPNPYYPNQTPQYMPARPGPLTQNPSNSRSSSMVSQNSNASSLLAKRRGEQKAQTLTLMNENDKKRQQAKWRVLKERDIAKAKSPGWRPQLAGGDSMQVVERTELPSTPGWKPKLTPTRRGDELFLSVH